MGQSDSSDLVGCCGNYCGLCNKFQSQAPSRCVGCRPGGQHSWCSIWNCCVEKRGLHTCAECSEAPDCKIFVRRKVAQWVPVLENLRQIREGGLESWLAGQEERQRLVEELLRDCNEGRSMSFYCRACARMPVEMIERAIEESKGRIASENVDESDIKSKAKIVKAVFNDVAAGAGVDLT